MSFSNNRACCRFGGLRTTIPGKLWHNTRSIHASSLRHARQQDHYHVLGLTKSSSKRDIKNKYYEVSREFYCSKGGGNATSLRFTAKSREDADNDLSSLRQLSKKSHPDRKGGDRATFEKVTEAYSILGDDAKRYVQLSDTESRSNSF